MSSMSPDAASLDGPCSDGDEGLQHKKITVAALMLDESESRTTREDAETSGSQASPLDAAAAVAKEAVSAAAAAWNGGNRFGQDPSQPARAAGSSDSFDHSTTTNSSASRVDCRRHLRYVRASSQRSMNDFQNEEDAHHRSIHEASQSSSSSSLVTLRPDDEQLDDVIIEIWGMNCISCAPNVERVLRSVDGVADASVNYFTSRVRITLESHDLSQDGANAICRGDEKRLPEKKQDEDHLLTCTVSFTPDTAGAAGSLSAPTTTNNAARSVINDAFSTDAFEDEELDIVDFRSWALEQTNEGAAGHDDTKKRAARVAPRGNQAKKSHRLHQVAHDCCSAVSALGYETRILTEFIESDRHRGSGGGVRTCTGLQYSAQCMEQRNTLDEAQWRRLLLRSSSLMIPIILLEFLVSSSHGRDSSADGAASADVALIEWIMCFLATAVQFWIARRFYRPAYLNWRATHLLVGTDFLIVLGTTALYLYSLIVLLVDTFVLLPPLAPPSAAPMPAFAAAPVILTVVIGAKFIESHLKKRMNEPLRHIMMLQPTSGLRVEMTRSGVDALVASSHQNGKSENSGVNLLNTLPRREVPIERIERGDYLLVPPGSPIPTDGVVVYHSHAFSGGGGMTFGAGARDHLSGDARVGPSSSAAMFIDESALNGEPFPVPKYIGEEVTGGFCVSPIPYTLLMRATAVGDRTVLGHVVRLLEERKSRNAPSYRRMVDKLSLYFVPGICCLSLVTFVCWMVLAPQRHMSERFYVSFASAVGVLLTASPWALMLATPIIGMLGADVAEDNGILMKGGFETLESSQRIDTVVFDKAAISSGNPTVKQYIPFLSPTMKRVLDGYPSVIGDVGNVPLWLAACAESQFLGEDRRVLGRAIVEAATDLWAAEDEDVTCSIEGVQVSEARMVPGCGVECLVEKENWGRRYVRVGSKEWVTEEVSTACRTEPTSGIEAEAEARFKELDLRTIGQAVLYVSVVSACHLLKDDKQKDVFLQRRALIGAMGIADPVHVEAPSTVLALQKMGIEVWMCTGDDAATAEAVASEVGIPPTFVCSNFDVRQQADLMARLRKRAVYRAQNNSTTTRRSGRRGAVALVGIDANDAMDKADVGIVVGTGAQVVHESADIVLVRRSLHDVVAALNLSEVVSRKRNRTARFALGYNLVWPYVTAGLLYPLTGVVVPPTVAASVMAFTSLSVATSSNLLRIYSKPAVRDDGRLEVRGLFHFLRQQASSVCQGTIKRGRYRTLSPDDEDGSVSDDTASVSTGPSGALAFV